MGDLFFMLRMAVYTLLLVIVMQVKIGPTTIEEKVIDFTHNSSLAEPIQKIAEGAVRFLGVAYNKTVQNVDSAFSKNHIKDNIPGQRLKETLGSTKSTLRDIFGAEDDVETELPAKSDNRDE